MLQAVYVIGHILPYIDLIVASVDNPSSRRENKNKIKETISLSAFDSIMNLCDKIKSISSSGGTSFSVPADRSHDEYDSFLTEIKNACKSAGNTNKLQFTTYVNFDTDGGNNGPGPMQAIKKMVQKCNVVGGVVCGFGAWVDQDCASKVAKLVKGPCQLVINVPQPDSEGGVDTFKRDINCWIKTIRFAPVDIKIHADCVTWSSRIGNRQENGIDVLAVSVPNGDDDSIPNIKFDLPDVKFSTDFTASSIQGVNGGDCITLYILSRAGRTKDILSRVHAQVNDLKCSVQVGVESSQGIFLASEWLSVLTNRKNSNLIVENKSTLCSRLRDRLEDDLR